MGDLKWPYGDHAVNWHKLGFDLAIEPDQTAVALVQDGIIVGVTVTDKGLGRDITIPLGSRNWGKSEYLRQFYPNRTVASDQTDELMSRVECDQYYIKNNIPLPFASRPAEHIALDKYYEDQYPTPEKVDTSASIPSPASSRPSIPEDFVPSLDELRKRMALMRISDWA